MGAGRSQFSEEELQDYQVSFQYFEYLIFLFYYFCLILLMLINNFNHYSFYRIWPILQKRKFFSKSSLIFIFYFSFFLFLFFKVHFLHSAHQKFKALAPEKVGHNRNAKLPMSKILQYPELRVNPFGDRSDNVILDKV